MSAVELQETPDWDLLDFPVEKVALPDLDINGTAVPLPDSRAVVRTDTNTVLKIVGRNYKVVPHRTLFEPIHEELESMGVGVKGVKTQIGLDGGYARVTWTLEDAQIDIGGGDLVDLEITAANSYNYKSRLSLAVEAMRLICTNGLRIGTEFAAIRRRHAPGVILNDLHTVLRDLPVIQEQILPQWQAWKETAITPAQFEERLEKSKVVGQRAIAGVVEYFDERDPNAWEAYNALTWRATHQMNARVEGRLVLRQEKAQRQALAFANTLVERYGS